MPISVQVIDVNILIQFQPKWAPQACGPLCFAHAAQSIATPLSPSDERRVAGTTRADDDADVRSRRRDVTSATG